MPRRHHDHRRRITALTGGVAVVGALAYGVIVGRIEPLPVKGAAAPSER